MLVDGTAKPMIIVTVDMYTSEIASRETATGEQSRTAYDNFVNDLQNDLMPFIERTYSVKTGRENTGIIGTSQGGTECLAIGFIMQDKIGYIALLHHVRALYRHSLMQAHSGTSRFLKILR